MTSTWFAVLMALLFELMLGKQLMIVGVWLPITLICLLTLRQWRWITWSQGLLLTASSGYVLDIMTSPRAGRVVIGFVVATAVAEAIWWRWASRTWLRPLAPVLAFFVYWLVLESSFGFSISWRDLRNAGLFTSIAAFCLWLVQSLTRKVARRL